MDHLLQALAQHWHLSASQYWQMHLLCTLTLGPLVGVLCLIIFNKRSKYDAKATRLAQRMRNVTLRPTTQLPS